jgi:hypothetical protein
MFLFVSLTPGTWDLLWRAAGGHQPVARAPSTAGRQISVESRRTRLRYDFVTSSIFVIWLSYYDCI